MPLPTTAAEVEMMLDAWRTYRDDMVTIMNVMFAPTFDFLMHRVFLRRPHTDDMVQMLVDLGIEPPDGIPPDGLAFTWGRR